MNQIRTEQIEFVIQSDEPTHQLVFYPAVHQFIVSILSGILCLTGSSRVANLIATLVAPVRPITQFGFAIVGWLQPANFCRYFERNAVAVALNLKIAPIAALTA